MKKRILFFIADLGGGGAEKVLVNLVNNLDSEKYDITVRTIFGKGVNAKFLKPHIKYKPIFPFAPFHGYTQIQKLFSPKTLYKLFIKGEYDLEIAYMHHVPTRVIAGSTSLSPKFAWVHTQHVSPKIYKSKEELILCYQNFNGVAFVSDISRDSFPLDYGIKLSHAETVHNVVDSYEIKQKADEPIEYLDNSKINLCSVGRLSEEKGYDRLLKILGKLKKENFNNWHFYLLGAGNELLKLKEIVESNHLTENVTFLGFDANPHKHVKNMDLFVCSSFTEGYSTAVTESIIVGTPILTTDCSGMHEILGESGAGIIVENSDEALYCGLKNILSHTEAITVLRERAKERSTHFSTEILIQEFESFIGTLDA
ncbi:MAG: glycosyltransferase [Bacteroides sp.]|nr:glycosyltransferase [Bacteroides sp.]